VVGGPGPFAVDQVEQRGLADRDYVGVWPRTARELGEWDPRRRPRVFEPMAALMERTRGPWRAPSVSGGCWSSENLTALCTARPGRAAGVEVGLRPAAIKNPVKSTA